MTVGKRIKKRRKQLKLSVDQLAEKLNKNRATVYRYEGDEIDNMPLSVLEPLAKALNVTPGYLMGWEDINPSQLTTEYPYFPIGISAGLPIEVDGITDAETISLPDSVMGKWAGHGDIYIMKVNGESMNKTIPHESLIAVKSIEISNLKDGDIVVYSDNHDYSVKRFYDDKENERIIFSPDSIDRSFVDYTVPYNETRNLKIHGKVVLYVVELS